MQYYNIELYLLIVIQVDFIISLLAILVKLDDAFSHLCYYIALFIAVCLDCWQEGHSVF